MKVNNKVSNVLYLIVIFIFILLTFIKGNFSNYLVFFLFFLMILGFILKNHKDKLFYLELFLVLTMVHTFIILHLMPSVLPLNETAVGILKSWKVVYILLMLIIAIINSNIKDLLHYENYNNYEIFMLVFSFIVIIGVFRNDNILAGIYGARNYLEGMIVYFIARKADCSKNDIKKLINSTAYFMIFLCFWGVFQAYVLGDSYLINLGYGSQGKLSYTFYISGFHGIQRVVSTFASANTFAVYIQLICLYLLSELLFNDSDKVKNIISFIIGFVALALTFSRSAWVGFTAAAIILFISYLNKINKKSHFKLKKKSLYLIIIILGMAFIILASNIKPSIMIRKYIMNTLTLKDTSARGHLDSVKRSVKFIIDNKFGVGVGKSGPKSYKYAGDNFLNSESSYLIIGMDMGILGIVSYLIYLFFLLLNIKMNIKNDYLYLLLFSMWAALLIAYMFLPLIQELEHVYYIYTLTGLIFFMDKRKTSQVNFGGF